jgi:hypothetical protein
MNEFRSNIYMKFIEIKLIILKQQYLSLECKKYINKRKEN